MGQYEIRPSGFAVPVEAPEKPPREYGPLEFRREETRREVYAALNTLYQETRSGGIQLDRSELQDTRRVLVVAVAKLLLGKDVEFEELC